MTKEINKEMIKDMNKKMTKEECMQFIDNAVMFGSKLGLDRITNLMEVLGNPQDDLKFVHVAGTNGKGSTVSYISSILIEAGYKVGIFTSPYLQRFTERIKVGEKVDGKVVITELPEENLIQTVEKCKIATEKLSQNKVFETEDYQIEDSHPTFFEILTAMAFLHFKQEECDIVILEVGLGGTLDSTNIIKNTLISVITAIDKDHTRILGETIEEIAENKAGIIKENIKVVSYPQKIEAENVIKKTCHETNSLLTNILLEDIKILESNAHHQIFNYNKYENLEIGILGNYQCVNASVAVKTCELLNECGFKVEENAIISGLKNTKWTGRMEILQHDPTFLIDVAHNPHGANAFYENIKEIFPEKTFLFIVGVLADKDYETMFKPFVSLPNIGFLTTTPDSSRAMHGEDLAKIIKNLGGEVTYIEEIPCMVEKAFSLSKSNKNIVICAFGSMYFVGNIRDYFENMGC